MVIGQISKEGNNKMVATAAVLGTTSATTSPSWANQPGEKVSIPEVVKSFDPSARIENKGDGYTIDFSDGESLQLEFPMGQYHVTWLAFLLSIPSAGYTAMEFLKQEEPTGIFIGLTITTVLWTLGSWAFSTWIDLRVTNGVVEALAETKEGKVTKLQHLRGLLEVLFALQRCPSWTRRLSWNPSKWRDSRNSLDRDVTDRIVRILDYLYKLPDERIREFGRQDLFDQQINLAEKKVKDFLPIYWRKIAFPGQTMYRLWKTGMFFAVVLGAVVVSKFLNLLP